MRDPKAAAQKFLQSILSDERGLGLLHGPEDSGKSALLDAFILNLPGKVAVADVDGTRLHAQQFLSRILEQFGYGLDLDSADDLLKMLKVIVLHLTRSHEAPILIVRNLGAMYPSCLAVLCSLASQRVHHRYALRIVLVGDRPFHRIIDSPKMGAIAERLIGRYELKPEIGTRVPALIVSLDGQVIQQLDLADSKVLVGRSDFCDIYLDGHCISRQHALLIRDQDALILFDLRSRNGTSVNSIEVTTRVLHDSDVIAIGDYRLKVLLPDAYTAVNLRAAETADTARMKQLEDARREKVKRELDVAKGELRKA